MGRAVNVLDPQWYVDPWDDFRWLRGEAPCYWDGVNALWAVSRHADVVAIEKDTRRYSSAGGSRPRIAGQPSMIDADDPLHQNRRRLVARRFTPRAVHSHEDHVRAVVDHLLDRVVPDGGCEVVADLAAPLPASVIGRLLGFPPELWPNCQEWSELTMHAAGQYPVDGGEPRYSDAGTRAGIELAAAVMELVARRRVEPADDLVSVWCHAEVEWPDGKVRAFTDEEIVGETFLLLDGGAETTRAVIATMAWELLRHDDQRAQLVRQPELLEHAAVEEMIRWVSPIVNMARTARDDHLFHGEMLHAGDEVVLLYPSANRDERAFDDPERLDLARARNSHVAFGFGTHFCLGASLARLEIRVAYEQLLRRGILPTMRLAAGSGEPHVVPGSFSRTIDRLEIEFDGS